VSRTPKSNDGPVVTSPTMARSLVLNASYEPLSVVTARRAVVLVLNGKAHLLESVGAGWHAERMQIPVPSVVKLNRYVKVPYGQPSPLTRNAVFARDKHRCQWRWCLYPG